MWTKNLYCPICGTEIKEVLSNTFEDGYKTFTCHKCRTEFGVWLTVVTYKAAVADSAPEIIRRGDL